MELKHKDMPDGYYGYIYKITNLLDGRNYIGQHKLSRFDEPFLYYMGSSKDLTRDIASLKIENFKKEIIKFASTAFDLAKLEKEYILSLKIKGKAEYNRSIWIGVVACVYCKIGFTNPSSLRKHQSDSHDISYKEKCSFCEEMISRGGGMAAHLRGKHPAELDLVPKMCEICGETSFLNGFQIWHFNEKHSEKLECQDCEQLFVKPKMLLKHQEDSPCSRKDNLCECGNGKDDRSKLCLNCEQQKRRDAPPRFDKDQIVNDLKSVNGNFTKLSKIYGVSDNAIRKWLKKYDLPVLSKYYKNASVKTLNIEQSKN